MSSHVHELPGLPTTFGRNTAVRHMPVGQRLAYDAVRGRLWIVCRKCQEWSLTPIEERWEAIEECERLFAAADVHVASRAPTTTIGLAQAGDVALLRFGDAPRDEIANARYGPRLLRRQAQRRRLAAVAGVAAGVVAGTFILVGMATGSIPATAYLAAMGVFIAYSMGTAAHRFRLARFHRKDGTAIWLTAGELQSAHVPPHGKHRGQNGTDFAVWNGRADERFYHDDVLAPLAAILPSLNANGGSPLLVASAVRLVDETEAAVQRESPNATSLRDRQGRMAWQRLLQGRKGAEAFLYNRPLVERLALEIAVAEELERRLLAGDAASVVARAEFEGEVAGIADNMFLPQAMLEWIARYKGRLSTSPATLNDTSPAEQE
ncbi:MAG: hypothetical protein M3Z05_09295 [Gemmatimonadota bacterium]|nr:hypothetical protein [Gemmatimonadota bacterium]